MLPHPAKAHDEPVLTRVRLIYLANVLSDRLRSTSRPASPPKIDLQAGDMRLFANAVIRDARWQDDVSHITDLISVALVPSAWPSEGMPALRDAAGRGASVGVCGRVWRKDELAYKCKTCERDPTCVVCVQCFKRGDHTGHDFAMVRTAGGCCDCGDVQAWQPDGFCSMHLGASSEADDPSAALPSDLKQNLLEAVEAVATAVLSYCLSLQTDELRDTKAAGAVRTAGLLDWLTDVVQCGDGIRRAVGVFLTAPLMCRPGGSGSMRGRAGAPTFQCHNSRAPKFSWLSMMLEIDGVERLPENIQTSLHGVYFQLITDLVFKRAFLGSFASNYERYMHARVKRQMKLGAQSDQNEERHSPTDIVENFTVQLFTVPALVPVMIQRGGLLDVLLGLLLSLFESIARPVTPYAKGIPLAESAFANEYQSSFGARDLLGASPTPASSSEAHFAKRGKTHRLPIPFATREPRPRPVIAPLANSGDNQVSFHSSDETDGRPLNRPNHMQQVLAGDTRMLEHALAQNVPEPGEQARSTGARTAGGATVRWRPTLLDRADDPVDNAIIPDADDIGDAVIVVEGDAPGMEFPDHVFRVEVVGEEAGDDDVRSAEGYQDDFDGDAIMEEQMLHFERSLQCAHPKSDSQLGGEAAGSVYAAAIAEARGMEEAAMDGSGPLAHSMRLDWSHGHPKIADGVCGRVLSDLKYVLNHSVAAHEVVHVREDLFRKFVRVLSMAQGMGPLSRRFGDHVPMEDDSWGKTFPIEMEFYHCVELLALAFCNHKAKGGEPTSSDMELDCPVVDMPASRLRCIRIVKSCLDEWIDREEALEARSIFTGETFSAAHSSSVHLPLHRFFAFLVHHSLRLDGTDLKAIFASGNPTASDQSISDDARRVLQHPLRIQSFLAQVRAGMWRRNGRPVLGQSTFYRSVFCSEWYGDLDLFVQQCCAVLMGPDMFLTEVQKAYRIRDFSKVVRLPRADKYADSGDEGMNMFADAITSRPDRPNLAAAESSRRDAARDAVSQDAISSESVGLFPLAPKLETLKGKFSSEAIKDVGNTYSELVSFLPSLLEDFLVHIVRVISERARCGASEAEYLRRKLLHQLCCKDRTHSQLYRTCSFRVCNELDRNQVRSEDSENPDASSSVVESTLRAISDYVEPKGMEQGKYRLKDDLWKEFDPFSPHLNLRDRCAAEVRHEAACKRQGRAVQLIPDVSVHDKSTFSQLTGLEQIIFAASQERGVATEMLRSVLSENGDSQGVEGSLSAALYMVCAAVEAEPGRFNAAIWTNESSARGELERSGLGAVCEMYTTIVASKSDAFVEFKAVLERVLNQGIVKGAPLVRELISRGIPQQAFASLVRNEAAGVTGGKTGRQDLDRREILLRRKKEQQAAVLAQMQEAQASFARHIGGERSSAGLEAGNRAHRVADESAHATSSLSSDGKLLSGLPSENKTNRSSSSLHEPAFEDVNECALCHDVGTKDASRLIGLIGFHQNTRVPAIARSRCADGNEDDPTDVHVSGQPRTGAAFRLPPHTSSGKINFQTRRNADSSQAHSTAMAVDRHRGHEGLRKAFLLNSQMIQHGVEEASNLHIAFCGHAIHIHCFDRYFSSLMHSRANQTLYEGFNVLNLDRLEFLCPVCRRLANMVLPLMNGVTSGISREVGVAEKSSPDLTHDDWVACTTLQLRDRESRELSKFGVRLSGSAQDSSGQSSGELASTVNKLRLSIISRGKAVLNKFGLQSFQGSLGIGGSRDESSDKEDAVSDYYARLPSAAISTVACAEIASRSGAWAGTRSHSSRKSLRTVLREARAHISLEPEPRFEGLRVLWDTARSDGLTTRLDPFATVSFLFLLWFEPVTRFVANNLVRLGLNMIVSQKRNEAAEDVTKEEFGLIVLLYLRRMSIVVSAFFESSSLPPLVAYNADGTDLPYEDVENEVATLMGQFQIPMFTQEALSFLRSSKSIRTPSPARFPFRPRRVGLIRLPPLFQSLLEDLDGKNCNACGRSPKTPAICLVCGDFLCSASNSCSSGRLVAHAKSCGAGVGVYLVLKYTSVQVIRSDRVSGWGSPYLDEHGEEDEEFTRGTVLYLNAGRYRALEELWLTHGFDQDSRLLSITMPTRLVHAMRRT